MARKSCYHLLLLVDACYILQMRADACGACVGLSRHLGRDAVPSLCPCGQVVRVGPMHQAGSDSLLTSAVFFKMTQTYFGGHVDEAKHVGVLYGLGSSVV